ncbi:MAG: MFS transporter [Actinomycetota bacterium]
MRTGFREASNNRRRRPRLVTRPFLLVMLSTLAYFISVGALIPTLPRYVKGPLQHGDAAVGLTIGSFALAAVVLRPMVGRLGDVRGRRLLIVAGGTLVGVSVLAYIPANALGPLLLLRLLSGAGEAFFYVGAASVINDLAPDERRGEALSYFSLALFAGIAVGPAIGEFVLGATNFDVVWLVAAVTGFFAGALGFKVPETRPEDAGQQVRRRIVHPAALEPGMILAASIWGLATFTAFVPLYTIEIGMSGSRLVFVVHAVTIMLIRSFGARIPDVLGPGRSARLALTVVAAGLIVMGTWAEPAGLFVGTFVFALGQAFAFPALMTLALRGAPAAERGSVVGTFTAFFDLAFGVGAVSAGAIAEVLGYRGSFLSAAGIAIAGLALLMWRKIRAARLREAEAAA